MNLSKIKFHFLFPLVFALLSFSVSTHAQSENATTVAAGQITTQTCALGSNMILPDGTFTSRTVFSLGTLNPSASTGAAGTPFGNTPFAYFFTVLPTGACNNNGTSYLWDVALALSQDQITTLPGVSGTFLKNALTAAQGGTDAVVRLSGGTAGQNTSATPPATTTLNLVGGQSYGGTLMSGSSTISQAFNRNIVLSAQFVRAGSAAPSAGLFTQTIPLLIVYR